MSCQSTSRQLRDRADDIPELVTHFLDYYNEQNDRYVAHIDPKAMEALQNYTWPGNVRELQNNIERAVVMATGDELTYDLLPPEVTSGRGHHTLGPRPMDFGSLTEELVRVGINGISEADDNIHGQIVDPVEREVISQVMSSCENVQIKAAARLGINRNTLHKKLKQYGLDSDSSDK